MNKDDAFKDQLCQALDAEAEGLDYRTQLALKRARAEAIHGQQAKRSASAIWWSLATVTLSALLVLTLTWNNSGDLTPRSEQDATILFADLEILASDEPIEFYADMEFYLWLDENETDDATA